MMPRRLLACSLLAACGDAGGFPDAPLADTPPTGTFSLTWSVVDHESQPIACERIAAQSMTVLAHNKGFDGGSTQIFTCASGMGQSQAVFAGLYDLDFELSGTFGLLASGTKQTSVQVPAGTNTPLQPVTFQVKALGGMALKLSAGGSGNCAGGAGIEQTSISFVRNSDSACQPVTFTISDGAMQSGGTYTATCPTPTVIDKCIDADQVLTATDVPSDAYTIRVRGKIGGTDCWVNNDFLQVPPLDQTLTRTLNLAQTPGC